MADSKLPSDYDVVVLGTGMCECILAAAFSRIGYSVLHLDRYDYYSGDWTSFHFKGLLDWIEKNQNTCRERLEVQEFSADTLNGSEKTIDLAVNSDTIRNVKTIIHIKHEHTINDTTTTTENVAKLRDSETEMTSEESVCNKYQTESSVSSQDSKITNEDMTNSEAMSSESTDCRNETDSAPTNLDHELDKGVELKDWSFSEIKNLYKQFNLDLMPKVLYCKGSMVELLISSDVAKYCEFKTVSRVLTYIDGKLEQVPCSRADVFSSKQVSMIEKRMMMKFLTFCIDYEKSPQEYEGWENKLFSEFLSSKMLSANVKHYIQKSIAMVPDKTSTLQGLMAAQKFLRSLGRYGNTAFLWPVYGSGELPQCFCRMCAVFGGIYCLKRTAQSIVVGDDNKCVAVLDTEGQRLNTKWLIAEASYMQRNLLSTTVEKYTSRAILFTDRSLSPGDEENITLLSFSAEHLSAPVTIFELPPSSYACPKDIYVVHMMCESHLGAEADFNPIVDQLFQQSHLSHDMNEIQSSKPKLLWSVMFEVADSTSCSKAADVPDNVFVVGGPNNDLDYDYAIAKAREIFIEICPAEEFLPKAPNPEDIIWGDNEGKQSTTDSGFQSEKSNSETGEEGKSEGESQEQSDAKGNFNVENRTNSENQHIKDVSDIDNQALESDKEAKTHGHGDEVLEQSVKPSEEKTNDGNHNENES